MRRLTKEAPVLPARRTERRLGRPRRAKREGKRGCRHHQSVSGHQGETRCDSKRPGPPAACIPGVFRGPSGAFKLGPAPGSSLILLPSGWSMGSSERMLWLAGNGMFSE